MEVATKECGGKISNRCGLQFQHLFFLIEVATSLIEEYDDRLEIIMEFQHLFFLIEVATQRTVYSRMLITN